MRDEMPDDPAPRRESEPGGGERGNGERMESSPRIVVVSLSSLTHDAVTAIRSWPRLHHPSWSPCGRWIAAATTSATQAEREVRICDVASGEVTEWGDGEWPTWSPDSRQLAASTGELGVVVGNRTGGGRERIIPAGDGPAWSPDGRLLAFSHRRRLVLFDTLLGKQGEALPPHHQPRLGCAWSPDGNQLAFVDQLAGSHESALSIVTFNADRRAASVRIRYRGLLDGAVAWSPDGTELTGGMRRSSTAPHQIFRLTVMGNSLPRGVTYRDGHFDCRSPTYAPNGRQLAFTVYPTD